MLRRLRFTTDVLLRGLENGSKSESPADAINDANVGGLDAHVRAGPDRTRHDLLP